MSALQAPGMSLLLLFRARQPTREHPEAPLVKHFGLESESTSGAERGYHGVLEDGLNCRLRALLAHDTHVVRCDLTLERTLPPAEAWEELTRHGNAIVNLYVTGGELLPWGATWLYHAILPPGMVPDATPDAFANLWASESPSGLALEATPYGWLTLLGMSERPLTSEAVCRERQMLLLVPAERAEKVSRYFLHPLMQGWARIERHLHKAEHHVSLQQEVSQALRQDILRLREQMSTAASTMDFADIYRESRELEQVSTALMTFLNQKAHAEMVLQSLRINLYDFTLALEEVKLATPLYEQEKEQLIQHIKQLESDLDYARVTTESTYAFQEMQRGIENNRLQRASLMLATASALLAGIAIFNSFLDIWALILADSAWHLPPIGLRMAMGLLAGISLPAAAYMLIERRYRVLAFWGCLAILSVIMAVLSTIWVNR